jgi:hypothetical protein
MSQESVRPINPAPEDFTGDSGARSIKRFFHATRPKFYPASVLPVIAGTAFGVYVAGAFDAYVFTLALIATVCVHAASNVLNDVGDETIGTDRVNEQRIYPYTGGSRFIQMGILSQSRMARLGVGLLIFAALLGILLILEKGPVVLLFGITGVVLAVMYSLGPVKLSTLGVGEMAVAVGLGVLPMKGSAWSRYGSRWRNRQEHIACAPGARGNVTALLRSAIGSGHRHHLHDHATNAADAGTACTHWLAGTGLAGCSCYSRWHLGQRFNDASHRINIGHSHNWLHLAYRMHGIQHCILK